MLLSIALVVALATGRMFATAPLLGTDIETAIPNKYVVVLKPGISAQKREEHYDMIKRNHELRRARKRDFELPQTEGITTKLLDFGDAPSMYLVEADEATLEEIREAPEVAYVEADRYFKVDDTEGGEVFTLPPGGNTTISNKIRRKRTIVNNAEWNLHRISQTGALWLPYQYRYYWGWGGLGSTIVVIGTGVRLSHQEFEGRAYCGPAFGISITHPCEDIHGVSTSVAGLAIGKTVGVAKRAQVESIRIVDDDQVGTIGRIIQGIEYTRSRAATLGRARRTVINLSVTSNVGVHQGLNDAINFAYLSGILTVCSAGNSNGGTHASNKSPASAAEVVAVGALDMQNRRLDNSNFGGAVKMWAPGDRMMSAEFRCDNCYQGALRGTQWAAPIVSGLAAYFQSAYTGAGTTASIIRARLFSEAQPGVLNNPPSGAHLWNRIAYNGGAPNA